MANKPEPYSGRVLNLTAFDENIGDIETVAKALGSEKRLAILKFIGAQTRSVLEIAEALDLPISTATQHINLLEKADLLKSELQPASRGLRRMCSRNFDQFIFQLPVETNPNEDSLEISMPIGSFTGIEVTPTCGILGEIGIIGRLDDPASFFEPERIYAQMIWFHSGYIEYHFPNRLPHNIIMDTLEVSFEACSSAPLHDNDWPSDITVWINDTEIGTWQSPADYGGERGLLTPEWWGTQNSQYGQHKVWKVTKDGSYIDGLRCSGVSVNQLKLTQGNAIKVRIGVKEGAHNVGGLSLFGRMFGNYPQDILVKARYQHE
ncbi:MAG: helix-turn-helix domain-containing protein [Anaerolineaceae bacterium]|nr:helix-turn-helix domain-containing protein [Anaerolineaceae bacterium]